MDAEALRELFEPVGPVSLRRMFGGQGVYRDGLIFAIEADGLLYLKCNDGNRPLFEARGSRPFTYAKKGGEAVLTSYWSLPASAFDDSEELRELATSAIAASRRAASAKAAPRRKKTA